MMKSDRLAFLASSEPSRFLQKHVSQLDASLPVLDAPCGFGRNSLFLAQRGYTVISTDIDEERIKYLQRQMKLISSLTKSVGVVSCDLNSDVLPFRPMSFGAVVIVHFVPLNWVSYSDLLCAGGLLVFETMGGQGCNYLQLPLAGQIRAVLEPAFAMHFYRERRIGPPERNVVTVGLIARKK